MTSNIRQGFMQLSINHEGRVSLWDSRVAAEQGKETNEIAFSLELTKGQMKQLAVQQTRAKSLHDARGNKVQL